jgi:hypothetical protein
MLKNNIIFLILSVRVFSSTKLENRRADQVLSKGGGRVGRWHLWEGEGG